MFESIKNFFDQLGWLANMLALTPVVIGAYGLYAKRGKIMNWLGKRKYLNIADYVNTTLSNYSFDKKKVRIVVVDDNPDDFPIEYLRNTYGEVIVYDKFSLADTSRFIGFDLVFLDMMGVVKEDQKYGGLQLIKKVKEIPDPPIVVAVSGARFDPTATDYFKAADDVLKKPLTEIKCEEVINELIKEKVSPQRASDVIDSELMAKSKNEKEKSKALNLIISYLEKKITIDELRSAILNDFRHIDTALIIAKAKRINNARTN